MLFWPKAEPNWKGVELRFQSRLVYLPVFSRRFHTSIHVNNFDERSTCPSFSQILQMPGPHWSDRKENPRQTRLSDEAI